MSEKKHVHMISERVASIMGEDVLDQKDVYDVVHASGGCTS